MTLALVAVGLLVGASFGAWISRCLAGTDMPNDPRLIVPAGAFAGAAYMGAFAAALSA